ncbi:L,D-transpeptidase [Lacticaseibacillus kribbianus]|uniref:L,D-transpeptidase n=1 Tax=Lacticaseibacillus kribbianus TaxID=2926292 RepID=UPI0030844CAD
MGKWHETIEAVREYLRTHHLRPWVRWTGAALVLLAVGAGLAWHTHRLTLEPPRAAAVAGAKTGAAKAKGDAAKGATKATAAKKAAAKKAAAKQAEAKKAAAEKAAKLAAAKKAEAAKPVDWHNPSESAPYPVVTDHPGLQIDVSLAKQRVYLKDAAGKVLYTMYCSSGMDNSTPRGVFYIQAERGASFYNPREKMGANYYTSFLDHGVYLFHTVPTDASGRYIVSEAEKLGKKPGSHGCVRLSIADAKWINEHIPTGTKVTIA